MGVHRSYVVHTPDRKPQLAAFQAIFNANQPAVIANLRFSISIDKISNLKSKGRFISKIFCEINCSSKLDPSAAIKPEMDP